MGGGVATLAPTRSLKTGYLSVCYTTVDCQIDSNTLLNFYDSMEKDTRYPKIGADQIPMISIRYLYFNLFTDMSLEHKISLIEKNHAIQSTQVLDSRFQ